MRGVFLGYNIRKHRKGGRRVKGLARRALPPLLAFCVLICAYAAVHLALGTQPFAHSDYDSYTLQALAWREGRVCLGRDYPHLELAVYEGDWYVSFPPTPSLVQLPLTLLFGRNTPDGLLVKLYVAGAFWILYDYFRRTRRLRPWAASLWALFLVFATDMISVSLDGGVWYQAQTLNFLLLAGAFSAMARRRPTLSCLLYALAVGCRPFTALFGPVLLMMYLRQKQRPRLWPGLAVGLCVAACYAAYNYARFGNIFEFGHNYLPEFTRVETGQFSLAYLAGNVKTFLFGPPFSLQNGAWTLNQFGFSMFLCNPVLLMTLIWLIEAAARRRMKPQMLLTWLLMLLHLFCLLLHKSFGGFQFGARYTLELIPYAVAMLHFAPRRAPRAWEATVFSLALMFNAAGAYLLNR